jgi:hypothetical protein
MNVDWRWAELAVAHASTLKDVSSVLVLVKEETVWPLLYWDAEEVVERAKVLHRELLLESCSGTLEKLRARGNEDDVVDVEQHVSSVGAVAVDKQWGVWLGLHEAVVARSWRLLQTVEGLVEPTHQLRVSRVNEAGGLRAVDYLGECVMEEGILDVELVHGPTLEDS